MGNGADSRQQNSAPGWRLPSPSRCPMLWSNRGAEEGATKAPGSSFEELLERST